ncbi:hypothetical protein ACHAPU_006327 [Fusarium lateritium]
MGHIYPVLCFPDHPFEVQLFIGIFSWLGLLLDDEAPNHLDEFQSFHERFAAGEKQPIPLLQGWADLLKLSFKYWDPQVAGFIVTSALNFLNANALEARNEFERIERTKAGHRWAWFLREKDGVGEAFAWFTFPKALCPDISLFVEAIPDLAAWHSLTNDILSFWKEEEAGEQYNYIHNTGWYEDKDARTVFEDVIDDVKHKTQNSDMLDSPFLVGLVLLATAAYGLINAFSSPLRHIPGPWYTHFTHLILKWHIVSGKRVHYIHALHQKYGPIVRVSPQEIAVSDLDAFSTIHKIGAGFLKSVWYEGTNTGREPGIFAMRDPHQHAARRRLFARAFSVSSLMANWEPVIRQKTELAVQKIKEDANSAGADVFKWWTLLATDVIAELSFGESFRMLELGKQTPYIDAIQTVLILSGIRLELSWIYPILRYLPFKALKKILNAENVVFDHGAVAVRNMQSAGDGLSKANLFSQMLAAAEGQEKTSLSTSSIQAEAGNLIVAGSDTTAVTLTYLIWAVLNQPLLQSELELEVSGLSDELTFEELKSAPLLNSIVEETLRLYGAAPGAIPRVVPAKGATLCNHFIPAGTVVSTQAFTMHRNDNIFDDAQRFNGHRFMDKSKLTGAQKTALSPFGAGSRVCIGLHLAWMELRLGAALFFRECRGARLGPEMTDEMMELENHFLVAPKGHSCVVKV